jgi:predicted phosphodiesterase
MPRVKGPDGKFEETSVGIKAREYREKYGPKFPTRTLAKKLHEDYPMLYRDIESARTSLRRNEGKTGKKALNTMKDKSLVIEEARTNVPWNIPEPASEDLLPYKLPQSFNNFILFGDVHIPNHRIPPLMAMFKYAEDNGIDQCFLNGDLMDNEPFSKWVKKPPTPEDVEDWFNMAVEFLVELKKHFSKIYLLEGNHDAWYKRWLWKDAPLLSKDPHFSLAVRLKFSEIGITFIPEEYLVKAGHLNIIHGHIIFRGGGSYANGARMLYMKTKANTIASHLHVPTEHNEPDLNDKTITTWVTGCMCTLRPGYQPYGGKAAHGFAHIRVKPNGNFNVRNFKIQNGEIL